MKMNIWRPSQIHSNSADDIQKNFAPNFSMVAFCKLLIMMSSAFSLFRTISSLLSVNTTTTTTTTTNNSNNNNNN